VVGSPPQVEDDGKQHRTLGTLINMPIGTGFTLKHVEERGPSLEQVAAHPEWAEERERPMFLLVCAPVTVLRKGYSAHSVSAVKAMVSQRLGPSLPMRAPMSSRNWSHSSIVRAGMPAGTMK